MITVDFSAILFGLLLTVVDCYLDLIRMSINSYLLEYGELVPFYLIFKVLNN
jgi:hypothetical protein